MKDILIRLRLTEIEYDVKFDTWARGNSLPEPNSKVLYSGGDQQDWLLRQVENAVGELHTALRWCVVDNAKMTDDEIMDVPDAWEIVLRLDDSWKGTATGLKSYAHKYVVDMALADWYRKIGMPYEDFITMAEHSKEELVKESRLTTLKNKPFIL